MHSRLVPPRLAWLVWSAWWGVVSAGRTSSVLMPVTFASRAAHGPETHSGSLCGNSGPGSSASPSAKLKDTAFCHRQGGSLSPCACHSGRGGGTAPGPPERPPRYVCTARWLWGLGRISAALDSSSLVKPPGTFLVLLSHAPSRQARGHGAQGAEEKGRPATLRAVTCTGRGLLGAFCS